MLILILALISLQTIAQNLNDYQTVIVPLKFEFQTEENQYRLSTILKYRLEQYGFKAYYSTDQASIRYDDRCKLLSVDVVNESTFLLTRVKVVFKDCNNAVVFESEIGRSKEKMRQVGYKEALEEALISVKEHKSKFPTVATISGEVDTVKKGTTEDANNQEMSTLLFAQPIPNGYQLVDSTPKVVLKITKTSDSTIFMASSETKNGMLYKKDNYWQFEYYLNEKLITEKLNIKF